MGSSPCKTRHISGLRPLGLRKPGPPLKTRPKRLTGRKGGPRFPHLGLLATYSGVTVLPRDRTSQAASVTAQRRGVRRGAQHLGRGSALPGGLGWPSSRLPASPEKCGTERGGDGPSRVSRCGTRPVRKGPSWVARTRSPVLIPRVLSCPTVSWVRPGHSPALSTPMFPGGPRVAAFGDACPGGIRRALSSRPVTPLSGGAAGGGEEGAAPADSLRLRPAALPPSGRQGLACSAICWPRGDRAAGAEPRAGTSHATPPAFCSRCPLAPSSWPASPGTRRPQPPSPASPGARRHRVARLSAYASVLNAGRERSTRRNVGALRHLPVRDEDRGEESKIPGNYRLDGRC